MASHASTMDTIRNIQKDLKLFLLQWTQSGNATILNFRDFVEKYSTELSTLNFTDAIDECMKLVILYEKETEIGGTKRKEKERILEEFNNQTNTLYNEVVKLALLGKAHKN